MTASNKIITRLMLGSITIGPNALRPLVEAEIKRLALSMQQIGMITPITVRFRENVRSADFDDSYEIVTGRHRVAAALSLGWEEIDAIEIECSDLDAKLWEIAENLHRVELTALQRDEQVSEWIRLTAKKVSDNLSETPNKGGRPGKAAATAGEIGVNERDAQRAVKVSSLSDEAKAAAVEHGLDDNRTALLEAARETEPAAQVATILERAGRTQMPYAAKLAKNRSQRFDEIIFTICNKCTTSVDMKIHNTITADQANEAIKTLKAARSALSKLMRRITVEVLGNAA
jgi:ParB/RepB/Spo0J family partition protein